MRTAARSMRVLRVGEPIGGPDSYHSLCFPVRVKSFLISKRGKQGRHAIDSQAPNRKQSTHRFVSVK